ncbi:MAG: hypothetical protein GY941_19745 [Planctomycetes bacterium]|nr:hypothetical protein [Planctomycetota bacterium]
MKKKKDLNKIIQRHQNRESSLQKKMDAFVNYATRGHCMVTRTLDSGMTDRTAILSMGHTLYYEVKRPDKNGNMSELQHYRLKSLLKLGHTAGVFDDLEEFKKWVNVALTDWKINR